MEDNQNSGTIDLSVFDNFKNLSDEILYKRFKSLQAFEDLKSQELTRIINRISNIHSWMQEDSGLTKIPPYMIDEIRYILLNSYLFLASQYPESLNEINHFINRIKKVKDRNIEDQEQSSKE